MAGNMYEFVSKTWNPLAGECQHACGYCSTNSFRKRFTKMREKYSGKPRIIEKDIFKRKNKTGFEPVFFYSNFFISLYFKPSDTLA